MTHNATDEILTDEPTVIESFSGSIEPEKLICFNDNYLEYVKEFRKTLHLGEQTTILLKRLDANGEFIMKEVSGLVKEVEDNHFVFNTNNDITSDYDPPIDIVVRFDNVLGNIPMRPSACDMKILKISGEFKDYRKSLAKMKDLLSRCVGTTHYATLYYKYTSSKPTFCNGNYHTDCEILKVNKSNVEIHHFYTAAFVNLEDSYVNMVPYPDVDRFIAPDRYLQKVEVFFGQKYQRNFHDEN